MVDVKISAQAYVKILLHAAKYPHCEINGLLLVKKDGHKPKMLDFVDAVPLFHDCLYVTPMAELALIQVDQWASQRGLIIAGYYWASELLRYHSTERPVHHRIADKIADNFQSACLFTVDNLKLSPHATYPNDDVPSHIVRQRNPNDGKWKQVDRVSVYPSGAELRILRGIRVCKQLQLDLIDFDNHLDDVTKDWTNEKLNADIDDLVNVLMNMDKE